MRLAVLILGLSAVPAGAQQAANYKVDVKLVRLLVSVKDSLGNVVGSLDAKDFSVYDCGVRQSIAKFERQTELPLSISLLVDTSGSTAKDLGFEVTSADRFFKTLLGQGNPKDEAALYSFNESVTEVRGFTRDRPRLSADLRTLRPSSGTSLYDAILLAAEAMGNREGRHVIVVVTDGGDTTSRIKYADALEGVHLADAVVYPIVVVPITNNAGRNTGGEHALVQIARDSGGRTFEPTVGAELDQAFADIIRDLRTQYMIAYYPQNLPADAPRFHPVRLAMARRDLQPQTRTGYYGVASR
jgi:Ca-activated chloride channel family protein